MCVFGKAYKSQVWCSISLPVVFLCRSGSERFEILVMYSLNMASPYYATCQTNDFVIKDTLFQVNVVAAYLRLNPHFCGRTE